ncbi:hypothetical protein OHB39_29215 [Streptomyces sp. NBC_00047]|uniref:hypothetical protein n=1 Tax=Streptomyces sp. NBC_00047 TaxID=2975627 RepID=UPI00224CEFB0|nr:hypothetical protein [Streptomyces sp. NBC_00047]MCX5611604.1 hypothetical protein [Streptomyces sp. NBC_00047]
MLKKALVALGMVLVLQSVFALCLVSALQLLVLRSTPFGVTGASPVVNAVASKVSLDTRSYADESAVMEAIGQSKLYGAYLPGQASDTLIVVPAKSFFGRVELEAAFEDAAKKLDRPLTVKTVKPLPKYDRLGGVSGLLLIPLLIGGYLAAVLLLKATRTAAAPWHVAMLVGYSAVGALLTDLIAGPGIGAYSNSRFWPLLPCFILIAASVSLAAAAFQRLLGPAGTLVVATLFIIVGGSAAGGVGITLLPDYWQHLGAVFPPQHAITLVRNVIYFNGNNITTPLIVLGLYALAGGIVIGYLGRWRPVKRVGAAAPADTPDAATDAPAARPKPAVRVLVALAIAAVMQCLFTVNYISSAHEPVATDMPFGTTGQSPLLAATRQNLSLKVTQYPNEQAAKDAIDRAEIYGALIPGQSSNTLLVVPTLSDVAPLDLAANFEVAAKKLGQPLSVQQYAPHPLAKKDPFGLVESLMLVPLLVGGYMASTMLRTVTGSATGRRRLTALLGFSVLAGLAVNLVVGPWLQGYPLEKFWIVWPILSLIVAVVALVAAVLQKLLGAAGTLVTVIVVMLFGNPSSGGANGVPYLPAFWRDIGPFLPPRNAYILLRNTIYFDGHGTTQALVVLLVYLAVPAIALALLDRFRTPEIPVTRETEAEATALTVPVGGLP